MLEKFTFGGKHESFVFLEYGDFKLNLNHMHRPHLHTKI